MKAVRKPTAMTTTNWMFDHDEQRGWALKTQPFTLELVVRLMEAIHFAQNSAVPRTASLPVIAQATTYGSALHTLRLPSSSKLLRRTGQQHLRALQRSLYCLLGRRPNGNHICLGTSFSIPTLQAATYSRYQDGNHMKADKLWDLHAGQWIFGWQMRTRIISVHHQETNILMSRSCTVYLGAEIPQLQQVTQLRKQLMIQGITSQCHGHAHLDTLIQ
jgi:hypothetical protein